MGATCWPRPAPGQPSSWRGGEGRRAWSPPPVAPFSSSPSDCQPSRSQRAGNPGGRATGSGLEKDGAQCGAPATVSPHPGQQSMAVLRRPAASLPYYCCWYLEEPGEPEGPYTGQSTQEHTHMYTQHTTFSTHIHTSHTHIYTQRTYTPHAHMSPTHSHTTCTHMHQSHTHTAHAHTHTHAQATHTRCYDAFQLSQMSVDVGAFKYATTSSINFHSIHSSRKFSL